MTDTTSIVGMPSMAAIAREGQRASSALAAAPQRSAFSDRLLAAVQDLARSGRRVIDQSPISSANRLAAPMPLPIRYPAVAPVGGPSVEGTALNGQASSQATTTAQPRGSEAVAPISGLVARPPRAAPVVLGPPTATPAAPATGVAPSGPMRLADFPRPVGDNGRGMHWIPTTSQSREVVDRFVAELDAMKVKWAVILNEDTQVGANDYLVSRLVDAGIMPVMRVYTPGGAPIKGDIAALVRHYLPRGVQYYQLYNEPNLAVENQGRAPCVHRYLDMWIPAAKEVASSGGLPGFGALAPGGDFDDLQFLRQSLAELKRRGETATLDRAWLSLHNYIFNRPLDYAKDSNGFGKFRWYDAVVRQQLGRSMPIIGTEGGAHVGADNDRALPPLSEADFVHRMVDAYAQVRRGGDPFNFAYSYWLIANEEGGGHDPDFTHQALFRRDGISPLVEALKRHP